MRNIQYLVVHCSATKPNQKVTVADIDAWHKAAGYTKIGYHFVIYPDGTLVNGRDTSEIGAHVAGYNANSIGICYVGGLDSNGNPADTRTEQQKATLFFLLQQLREQYPGAVIQGHRDFPHVAKACPCFDARAEYKNL